MKTKLEMAHEWAMKHGDAETVGSRQNMIKYAWEYADAMQVEADKRECKERTDVLLTKDKDGNCLHFHHEFGHKKCMDCGASLEEWQPDWSQAPDGYDYWVATADHDGKVSGGWFYGVKPEFGESKGVSIYYSSNSNSILTDSFGYTGDWRESLRKRPK